MVTNEARTHSSRAGRAASKRTVRKPEPVTVIHRDPRAMTAAQELADIKRGEGWTVHVVWDGDNGSIMIVNG